MTDETFNIALGGRSWCLPNLPFRIIKSVQPALFQIYSESARMGDAPLTEAQIDQLAGAVWRAIAFVDSSLSFEDFLGLSFSVADLFSMLPPLAQAAGLRLQTATPEASPPPGKSTSTR